MFIIELNITIHKAMYCFIYMHINKYRHIQTCSITGVDNSLANFSLEENN